MPTHTTHRRPDMRLRAVALLALAALVAAFAFAPPRDVHAQDETYVDLSIEITVGTSFVFTARNEGTAAAYGVTVDIELADQTIHGIGGGQFTQESGSTCSGNIPGTTCISGVWTVGALGAGEETSFTIGPRLASGLTCCPGGSDSWSVPARAVIKNTIPEEEERFKGDNTAVGWILVNQGGTNTLSARADYWLEASVDDLLPDAGDTVKFTFKAVTSGGAQGSVGGAKVRLKLDDGMGTPNATAPSGTTFAAAAGLARTWDWDFDLEHPTASLELVATTTLDNPLPVGVSRSDLCLTAELTAERPADRVLGDTSAKICLREDPVTLLQTGETHLFTVYPCVGVSTYPCSSSDTVEMVVNGGESARAAGIGRDEAIMNPGNVFVQVKDHDGRVVTGSDLSWVSTDAGLPTSIDNSRLSSAEWTHFLWKIASSQLPTGGNLSIGPDANRAGVFVHTGTKAQHPPGGISPMADGLKIAFSTYIKFEGLGTYIIDFTQETRHNNGTATTTDDVDYSATGTYTFHVGPVAELEVRDGDTGLAPAGTRAFTIVAVNNGPDDAPAVQVTVGGLNAGDYVSHTATAGAFATSTGVWTIGAMREPGYLQDIYGRDGEVLTIITSAAVDTEITAEIENTQDYEVCIDSSGNDVSLSSPSQTACTNEDATNTWHTAKYYDYNDDNSTTTIKAKDGTGADLPSLQSAQEDTASIIVTWDAISEVSGRGVTHYEVQRQTNPWVTVADDVTDTKYVDTDVEEGDTFQYRIRAVNDWDHKGPWSPPMSGTVMVPDIPPPGQPTGLEATPLGTSEILVTWNTPTGAEVDHYQLQAASDAGFTTVLLDQDDVSGNSYSHSGLEADATWYYRVRAWNTDSPAESGDWSATANATTPTDSGPADTTPRVVTRTETEIVTVTVSEAEDPFAYFPSGKVSRAVAENSAPGSPVGAPVAVDRNPGNNVVYSLEGADAALFSVERDTGQILVGRGTMLDYESDRTSYSVEVVAAPSRTGKVRATVDIDVVDVAESASVSITPDGQPQVGEELTATLTHYGGEPVEPAWLWQRSTSGGLWLNIAGATSTAYTPTEKDAGRRLRVIVTYGEPDGDGQGVAGAVTQALAGAVATGPAATYDADGDGRIDADEVLAAIAAYYAGDLDFDGVMEVIGVYFAG